MSDLDPISKLQERLAELETKLTYVRTGKTPPQPVDLMRWQANGSAGAPAKDEHSVAIIFRSLRENWRGLNDAIRSWPLRVEERFSR
jgi:hypothetical protein